MLRYDMGIHTDKLAKILFSLDAIKLRPNNPFKWASGYFMPIYNDNRLLLSRYENRQLVAEGLEALLKNRKVAFDVIVGTSTAGISPGTTLADRLKLPFMYARDKPKDHGMRNQIEGLKENETLNGKRVLIYEDLISTGGSSLKPVQAVRNIHGIVTDLVSIFNYGLPEAAKMFEDEGVRTHSLLDYDTMIEWAQRLDRIIPEDKVMLDEWRKDPFNWGDKHGFPKSSIVDFGRKWREAVLRKDSILCAGLDPAEYGQRPGMSLPQGENKLGWCFAFVSKVAPYCAAVKINRNYIKDLSRSDTQRLIQHCHNLDLLVIDDAKLVYIGDTNDSGFYNAQREGFDAITYAPFPGNVQEAVKQAHARDLGLITLVLMSNKEFEVIKNSTIRGLKGYEYFALQSAEHGSDAMVIGAPSPDNHITASEVKRVHKITGDKLVLMPGVGAQGGEAEYLIRVFGDNVIANVGRAIANSYDPAKKAEEYKMMLNRIRRNR